MSSGSQDEHLNLKKQDRSADRAIIVTGASSGLGRAIAVRLGAAGYRLWITARSRKGLEETAAAVAAEGGPRPEIESLDLSRPGFLADFVQRVGTGPVPLFALINSAGVSYSQSLLKGDPTRWREMLDINVLAPLEGCRAAVEVMRRQGGPGHLINVSSIAAQWDTGGVYAASKRALEAISGTLRRELEADNIRIATIIPGGFATQLGRNIEPEVLQRLVKNMQAKGLKPNEVPDQRFFGDPVHIARAVEYVLQQPMTINIEKMVVRPPFDLRY